MAAGLPSILKMYPINNSVGGFISFKSINEGLLIDMGSAIWDKNSSDGNNTPVYAKKYGIFLKYDNK